MPPIVIAAGISAAGALAGGAMASRGASQAAKSQERAAREALLWEKQQYADEQARLAPFRDVGNASLGQIAGRLGVPAPTMPQGRSLGQMRDGSGLGLTGIGQAGLVPIQAPDGSVRTVPAHKVASYLQRGGRLASGGERQIQGGRY